MGEIKCAWMTPCIPIIIEFFHLIGRILYSDAIIIPLPLKASRHTFMNKNSSASYCKPPRIGHSFRKRKTVYNAPKISYYFQEEDNLFTVHVDETACPNVSDIPLYTSLVNSSDLMIPAFMHAVYVATYNNSIFLLYYRLALLLCCHSTARNKIVSLITISK